MHGSCNFFLIRSENLPSHEDSGGTLALVKSGMLLQGGGQPARRLR